jgi:type I restriction enzyme M protein
MTADGFSLDDKRNPIADNDIPDIVERFHNLDAETERTRKDKSFLVPVEEIREKGYDLSINKYKEIEREVVVYDAPDVIMERIESLEIEIQQAIVELKKMI